MLHDLVDVPDSVVRLLILVLFEEGEDDVSEEKRLNQQIKSHSTWFHGQAKDCVVGVHKDGIAADYGDEVVEILLPASVLLDGVLLQPLQVTRVCLVILTSRKQVLILQSDDLFGPVLEVDLHIAADSTMDSSPVGRSLGCLSGGSTYVGATTLLVAHVHAGVS